MIYVVTFFSAVAGYGLGVLLFHDHEPITWRGFLVALGSVTAAVLLLAYTPLGAGVGWMAEQSARGTVELVEGFEQGRQDFEQGRQDGATP